MSVTNWENGTRGVRLGQGTTSISTIMVADSEAASGICFAPLGFDGQPKGNEVVIEIVNAAGVISYIRAIAELLSTWNIVGEEEKVLEVKKEMEELQKKLNQAG